MIDGLNLTATSLGTLSSTRKVAVAGFLTGDLCDSNLTLTSSFGPKKDGLTKAVIQGCLLNTTINVQAGNVSSFTAMVFQDSRLYVGYTPSSPNFDDLGTFTTVNYIIRNFRTTAVPNPLGFAAFDGSEVVAPKLGTVRISWLERNNFGTTFGLRVKAGVTKNVGSVRIANTPPFLEFQNYTPTATGEVSPAVAGGLAVRRLTSASLWNR